MVQVPYGFLSVSLCKKEQVCLHVIWIQVNKNRIATMNAITAKPINIGRRV